MISVFRGIFRDRSDAGQFLAERLSKYADRPEVVVLALPRGGVPVAYEVARKLHAPLDVFVVRKLGVPGHEELAMGAIASGGVRVLNDDVLSYIGIPGEVIDQVAAFETRELERRELVYRGDRAPLEVKGRIVIIVDDGLATGSTMLAAVKALKQKEPQKIVVAVPVGSRQTCGSLRKEPDIETVCAMTPEFFQGVGHWYLDFSQTTDKEVRQLLAVANKTEAIA